VKTSVTSQPESTPKLVPTIFTGTEILVNSTPRVRERGSFTISIPTQPTTSTVTHTKLYTRFSTNETDIPTNKIGSLSGKEINLKTTLKKPQPTITTFWATHKDRLTAKATTNDLKTNEMGSIFGKETELKVTLATPQPTITTFWTTRKDRLTAKATTNDPKTNEMGSLSGEETKSKTTQQPSPVTKDGVTITQATLIDKPKTAPSRTTTLEDRTTVKETTNNPTTTKNRITTTAITTETSGDPVTTETTSNINQISSELKAKMTASTTSDNMNTKTEPVTTRTATTTTIANYYVKPTSDFMETMKENENFKNYIEKLIEEKILQMNEQVNFYLHNIFIIFVSTHKSQKGSR